VLNVALHIEWEKSKACAIAYSGWKADWWQRQAELHSQLDPISGGADAYLAEGPRAYAAEHTHLELSLVSQLDNKF